MNTLHHFQLMAQYNLRMNAQVYAAASQLSAEDLAQDMGAFFKSILGTLNHILVGDLFWLNRFALLHGADSNKFSSIKTLKTFPLDLVIQEWLTKDACHEDFKQDLTYHNSKGEGASRDFGELVAHLFNHQTHHRGQVSTLLSQKGIDVGGTDFLMDIPCT